MKGVVIIKSPSARGVPAFGGFAGSLQDQQPDSLHVSGCTSQPDFYSATSIATNGKNLISEGVKATFGKGKFQPDNRNVCKKYNDSDEDEWLLGFEEKGSDVYMKHCKVLIEPI